MTTATYRITFAFVDQAGKPVANEAGLPLSDWFGFWDNRALEPFATEREASDMLTHLGRSYHGTNPDGVDVTMTVIAARLNPLVPLAKAFVDRSTALGLKGKRRDDAAMDFFCGAVSALSFAGRTDDASHVASCTVMILAPRGFSEVQHWASLPAYLGTGKAEG